MAVCKRLVLSLALVALLELSIASVISTSGEHDQTANQNPRNATSDPILDMLDRERDAAEERIEALNNNVERIESMMETELDDETEDDDDDEEVVVEKKKKRKRKGKGKKRKGKGRKKNRRRNKPTEEELRNAWPTTDVTGLEPLMQADGRSNNWYSSRSLSSPIMSSMEKYFDVRDLEDYLAECTDCYERIDGAENLCPMHSPAMELKKWAMELEDVLSHGCAKPENCDTPGACCLARKAPFEPLIVRMTQMLKDVFHMVQRNCKNCDTGEPEDPQTFSVGGGELIPGSEEEEPTGPGAGMLGPSSFTPECTWNQWTPCSVTCGQGRQYRTKQCPAGAPQPTGSDSTETKDCDTGRTCQTCTWGSWSACDRTCGGGSRFRAERGCPPGQIPREESEDCNNRDCPVPVPCEVKTWSSWQSWSPCSVTCGSGNKVRRRTCETVVAGRRCGKTCEDWPNSEQNQDTQTCQLRDCQPCEQREWSQWSEGACSVTCGRGNKEMSRRCTVLLPGRECFDTRQCARGERENKQTDCRLQECPPDCEWSTWNSWSPCSQTCGRGNQERFRTCRGGRRCSRPGMCGNGEASQTNTCQIRDENDRMCRCEEASWSTWAPWSSCSQTCDSGVQTRERTCELVQDGRSCGPLSCGFVGKKDPATQTCMDMACPCEEAEWGRWSRWTSCSKTCGDGQKQRFRSCELISVGKKCGSLSCGYIGKEQPATQDCKVKECMCERREWTEWTESVCSATCGEGQVTRTRECRVIQLGDQCPHLQQCTELDVENRVEQCRGLRPCCVDPVWRPWSQWSDCPVTCGEGTISRTRSCDMSGNTCGRDCGRGETRETRNTRCGPKIEIGTWRSWGAWGACDRACGGGQRERFRQCSIRNPNACSTDCVGKDSDSQECNTQSCCEWSQWNMWSPCSASCGDGNKNRYRTCVGGRDCAGKCPGDDSDTKYCVERPMTDVMCRCEVKEWTTWEPWTACSASCGQGVQQRYRRCVVTERGQDCGSECFGDADQTKTCQQAECESYEYGDWKEWCPCDCNTGERARRRECIRKNQWGDPEIVDINFCINIGVARITEHCDVLNTCPGCIVDCDGVADGDYQACSSCKDYIKCNKGDKKLFHCEHNTQFDSFVKKCVPGLSPSCSLKESFSDCSYLADGRYPSTEGCDWYIQCSAGATQKRQCDMSRVRRDQTREYDHHVGKCITIDLPNGVGRDQLFGSPPGSPTCMRSLIRRNTHSISTSILADLPVGDAPADMYYDEEHGLTAEQRRAQYEEELKEKRQRAEKDAQYAEDKERQILTNKIELTSSLVSTDEKENAACVSDCDGSPAGKFASCKGCNYYVICTKYGAFRQKRCPRGLEFDTNVGDCVASSSSCLEKR